MANLTNGMKSVFTSNVDGLGHGMFLKNLELLWHINIEYNADSICVQPSEITQAILRYTDTPDSEITNTLDLSNWNLCFLFKSDREEPFKFQISKIDLDVDTRTLIATI